MDTSPRMSVMTAVLVSNCTRRVWFRKNVASRIALYAYRRHPAINVKTVTTCIVLAHSISAESATNNIVQNV